MERNTSIQIQIQILYSQQIHKTWVLIATRQTRFKKEMRSSTRQFTQRDIRVTILLSQYFLSCRLKLRMLTSSGRRSYSPARRCNTAAGAPPPCVFSVTHVGRQRAFGTGAVPLPLWCSLYPRVFPWRRLNAPHTDDDT